MAHHPRPAPTAYHAWMSRPRLAPLATLALAACSHAPSPSPTRPGDIGTADPFTLVATAADGGWIVLCQQRAGTRTPTPYLIHDSGPGDPLDEFVATGSDGDLLVAVTAGRLLLHDRIRDRVLDLTARGADPRDDEVTNAHRTHRAAALDERRVAFWRGDDRARAVVVLDIPTDREQVLPMPLPGGYRLTLAGPWLLAHPLEPNTALEPTGTGTARACAQPAPARPRSPLPTWVANIEAGTAAPRPDLVTTWGDDLIVRTSDGALHLESTAGARTLLTPAACRAVLGASDDDHENFLIACEAQPDPAGLIPLAILSRTGLRPLDIRIPGASLPQLRLLGATPWNLAGLANIVGTPDPWDSRTLATAGDHAFILKDNHYAVVDLANRARVDFTIVEPSLVTTTATTLPQQGPLVALDPFLIDLEQSGSRGSYEGFAHAVTSDGRILVSTQANHGPLRWTRARPFR